MSHTDDQILYLGTSGTTSCRTHPSGISTLPFAIGPALTFTHFALQLPIEVNLSSDSKGRAVACVYHLLRGKIFRRHGVDITNWILQQLRAATLPVNPLLPALIEEFVDAIVGSATTTDDAEGNGSVPFKMKRFEEADIRAVMNPSPPFVFNAPAVLMLYYLSSFEKRLTIASSSTNGKQTPAIPTGIKKGMSLVHVCVFVD